MTPSGRMGDIDYIVDLCDRALGSSGARELTFPWLRDEEGALFAVTAYYESKALAVIVLDEAEDFEPQPWLRDRIVTLLGRRVRPAVLVTGLFAQDASGALLRHAEDDADVVELVLGAARAIDPSDEWGLAAGLAGAREIGWTTYGPMSDDAWDDWEDDEPEPSEDDPQEDHLDPDDDEPDPLVGGVPELGWRSRPIAQAILGAAVLGRRAFEARYAGDLGPLDLQLLATLLLLAEENSLDDVAYELENLAAALAAEPEEVGASATRLRKLGLVERPRDAYDVEDPIALTTDGADAVREWLARAALLFPD